MTRLLNRSTDFLVRSSSIGIPSPIIICHRPHPFDLAREMLEAPAGLTIAEIMEMAQPDRVLRD